MPDLNNLRAEIDKIDRSLVELLAQRFRATDEVGKIKKELQLPATDEAREERQTLRIKEIAQQVGLREDIAVKVLRTVIDEVVKNHKAI
jgi:chorismate mutase